MAITRWLYAAILSVAVLLLVTAIPIDTFFTRDNSARSIRQSDVLFTIFGQLRHDIGAVLYLKADEYYHGGTHHSHGEEHHLEDDACCTEVARLGEPRHAHAHEHEHEHEHPERAAAAGPGDLFARVIRAITTHSVIHLQGAQSSEMLPWFYLATLFDPQCVQAYVVGGFWLGMELGKVDEGIAFLRRGLRNNPSAWEIYAQMGELYFISKKDYGKSAAYLRRAYALIRTTSAGVMDKKQILVFLAAALERCGQLRESLYYYEQLNALLNGDAAVAGKIKEMESRLQEEPPREP